RGSLASNGEVLVMGRVDGEVSGVAVEITETGAVSGRLKTPSLRSRGELRGEIEAQDVELSGHVLDETVIRAPALAGNIPAPGVRDGEAGRGTSIPRDRPRRSRRIAVPLPASPTPRTIAGEEPLLP